MPDPLSHLEQLQRWLQMTVSHPGGIQHGVESANAEPRALSGSVEDVILPSSTLSADARLNVYSQAYSARLGDCMASEFPMVQKALGDEIFAEFAVAYLYQYPSQSYTLAKLGERFAQFLAECRPAEESDSDYQEESYWPDFLIDLARLEWSLNEVFHAPGTEEMPPWDAAALEQIAPDQWESIRFTPAPCVRLLTFDWAVNSYYTQLQQQADAAPPPRRDTYVSITRRDYRVLRFEMSQTAFTVLESLIQGETVGVAVERAAQISEASVDELATGLQQWFAAWTRDRFFVALV